MGNGTKLGLVIVFVLGTVVVATFLDRDIDRAPSGAEQARVSGSYPVPAALDAESGSQPPDPWVGEDPRRRSDRSAVEPAEGSPGEALGGRGASTSAPEVLDTVDPPYGTESLSLRSPQSLYDGGPSRERGSDNGLKPVAGPSGDGSSETPNSAVPAVYRGEDRQPSVDPSGGAESKESGPIVPQSDPSYRAAGASSPKTHTVAEGDTLWGLAESYYGKGALFPKIVEANASLADANALTVGVKLTIPDVQVSPTPRVESETHSSEYDRYTIQDGDTLYDIAVSRLADGARWPDILKANPGLAAERLRVGGVINIPRK